MKRSNILLSAVAVAALAFAAPAFAQSDTSGVTVGVHGGGNSTQNGDVGLSAAYAVDQYVSGEVTWDHEFVPVKTFTTVDDVTTSLVANRVSDTVAVNGLFTLPVAGKLSAYAGGGLGYRWSGSLNEPTWDAIGGARYALTERLSADARVTYTDGFTDRRNVTTGTVGLSYRF